MFECEPVHLYMLETHKTVLSYAAWRADQLGDRRVPARLVAGVLGIEQDDERRPRHQGKQDPETQTVEHVRQFSPLLRRVRVILRLVAVRSGGGGAQQQQQQLLAVFWCWKALSGSRCVALEEEDDDVRCPLTADDDESTVRPRTRGR